MQPEEAFRHNKARAALIIPVHFGRDLARGANTPVQLLVDATDANTAKLLQGFAAEITQAYSAAGSAARPQPVRADVRLWYNPGRVSKKFYGPGMFVLGILDVPARCWRRSRCPKRASRRPSCRSTCRIFQRTSSCWERSSHLW